MGWTDDARHGGKVGRACKKGYMFSSRKSADTVFLFDSLTGMGEVVRSCAAREKTVAWS